MDIWVRPNEEAFIHLSARLCIPVKAFVIHFIHLILEIPFYWKEIPIQVDYKQIWTLV